MCLHSCIVVCSCAVYVIVCMLVLLSVFVPIRGLFVSLFVCFSAFCVCLCMLVSLFALVRFIGLFASLCGLSVFVRCMLVFACLLRCL